MRGLIKLPSFPVKFLWKVLIISFFLVLFLSWTSFHLYSSPLCAIEVNPEFHNESSHNSVLLNQDRMLPAAPQALQAPENAPSAEDPVRRILWWSTVYGGHSGFFGIGAGDELVSLNKKCKARCEFTMNKTLLGSSHGVIFHGWGNDLPTEITSISTKGNHITQPRNSPHQRYKDQVYIYMTMEAPPRIKTDMTAYKSFFNWTMTYRLDSDFPVPYGSFHRKRPLEIRDYKENLDLMMLANRTNLVAWMVSNCNDAPSKREKLVKELQKYIPVNIYGKCGSNKCNETIQSDCWKELAMSHKFYLSFENSLCKDYVTEKFFNAVGVNMVPIVYGGAHYSHQFTAGSFINVDSFASAKALADYLLYLDENDEEYLKYFQWRRYYRADSYWPLEEAYCGACERLHREYSLTTSIININDWLLRGNSGKLVCFEPRDIF